MPDKNFNVVLVAIFFFLFPGILITLGYSESYSLGFFIVNLLLFIIFSFKRNIKFTINLLIISLTSLFLLVFQLINYLLSPNDIIKTFLISLLLLFLTYISEQIVNFFLKIKNSSFEKISTTLFFLLLLFFTLPFYFYERNAIGALEENYTEYNKGLIFVTEPSHFFCILSPILICFLLSSSQKKSWFLKLLILIPLAIILQSFTGYLLILFIILTIFEINLKNIFFFIITIILLYLYSLNFDYTDNLYYLQNIFDRIQSIILFFENIFFYKYETINLSVLTFFQGYEFILDAISRIDILGVGSGNGDKHIIDYQAFNIINSYPILRSDPGFMLSRIVLEYGILFGGIYLFGIYKFFFLYLKIRKKILKGHYSKIDVLFVACFLATLINAFIRGGGYLHQSLIFYLICLVIINKANVPKK
jgi:hypothetical protein